jgi:type I restriction enzyme S subunit
MKPYPAYKDSGVEWIGKLPDGWVIQKLKYISCVNLSNVDKKSQDGQPQVRLCNYTDVYYNEFITSDLNFMEATATPEQIEKFALKKGDVLITKDSEEWDDIAVSAYVAADYKDVLCGYHLAHIRPYKELLDGRFLFRSFHAYPLCEHFKVSANGITRYGIGKYDIENALFFLPTPEQQAIAEFLDKKTALIDRLIEKKKRQIELLKEQRQAVINQAVTKGLDPTVEMKDSGIEWLGKIPKHWEVKRLRFVLNEKLKYGANESGDIDDPSFARYIRITDFDDDGSLRDDTFRSLPDEQAQDYLLNSGDILFARSGATVGKTFQFKNYSGRACFAGYLIKASPNPNQLLSDFLYFYTKSNAYENWKDSIFNQATIQNIGADKYQNLPIAVPSLDEQEEIIAFVHKEQELITTSISKAEKQIELLQEYRTALISEAVTGKIDVREAF